MPTIYEVKSGDNLSTIAKRYGVPFSAITGYRSGNPNLIYPGEKLTIGDSQGGDLGGTLPPAQPTGTTGKALPETPSDNLSVFRNLLRTVSERAGQEATATGVASMGFEPSRVSGGTLAGIVNFIKGQKTQGVADIYKSTTDLLDKQKTDAEDQLKLLISTGGLTKLNDDQIKQLSGSTDYSLDYLMGMKSSLIEEQTAKTEKDNEPTEKETLSSTKSAFIGAIKSGTGSVNPVNKGGAILGQDGFMAPEDWKDLKRQWVEDMGMDAEDFIKYFYIYMNPKYASQYGDREYAYLK